MHTVLCDCAYVWHDLLRGCIIIQGFAFLSKLMKASWCATCLVTGLLQQLFKCVLLHEPHACCLFRRRWALGCR